MKELTQQPNNEAHKVQGRKQYLPKKIWVPVIVLVVAIVVALVAFNYLDLAKTENLWPYKYYPMPLNDLIVCGDNSNLSPTGQEIFCKDDPVGGFESGTSDNN